MKYILACLLLFATTAFGQTADVQAEFNTVNGIDYNFNFVWNPSAYKNIRFTQFDGDAHRSRDTAAGKKLDNKASFLVDTTNINDQVQWEFRALSSEYTTGTCYAKGRYKGNASSVEAQVYNNTGVYPYVKVGGVLLTNATDWTDFGFLYPCATSTTRSFRVMRTLTGSGAEIFNIGQIHVGKLPLPNLASVRISTNEASYTPTYTGFGTVSTSNMKWYQDGAYLYIYGSFVTGTPTAVEARMSFPTGYVASSTISTIMLCGDAGRNTSSTTYFRNGTLCEPSLSYLTFGSQSSSGDLVTKATGSGAFAAGNVVQINAKIPIAGASNVNAFPASCINNPDCQNNFSAKISSTGVVSDESYSFINGNAALAASVYTITWDTSRFSVAPNCVIANNDTQSGVSRLNSVTSSGAVVVTSNSSFTAADRGFVINCSRAGTDVKPWGPIPLLSGMVSSNASTSERLERATFSGANGTTCPVTFQSGSWVTSCTRNSTGNFTISFSGSPFGGVPTCNCTAAYTTVGNTCQIDDNTAATASSIRIQTFVTGNTAADRNFHLICMGPR